jgi:hypothetical protein
VIEDYAVSDHQWVEDMLLDVIEPVIKKALEKEIKPRLERMLKDEKLLDKLAKDILKAKLAKLT